MTKEIVVGRPVWAPSTSDDPNNEDDHKYHNYKQTTTAARAVEPTLYDPYIASSSTSRAAAAVVTSLLEAPKGANHKEFYDGCVRACQCASSSRARVLRHGKRRCTLGGARESSFEV